MSILAVQYSPQLSQAVKRTGAWRTFSTFRRARRLQYLLLTSPLLQEANVNANPNANLNPNDDVDVNRKYDSNYWLCTITLAPELRIKGQENAYKSVITSAVGGAAGVVHEAETATTDCQPNDNVEALRVYLDRAGIEARPVWKPMHCQPVYRQGEVKKESLGMIDGCVVCQTSDSSVAYINGISEEIFKIGMCLPAGPYVSDDDVRYIVEKIREAIVV